MSNDPPFRGLKRADRASQQVSRHYAFAVAILAVMAVMVATLVLITQGQHKAVMLLSQKNAEQRVTFAKAGSLTQALMRQAMSEQPSLHVMQRMQKELQETAETLRANHEQIYAEARRIEGAGQGTGRLTTFFDNPPYNLDSRLTEFLDRTEKLAGTPPDQLSERFRLWSAQDIASAPNSALVRGFDGLFSEMHKHSEAATERARNLTFALQLTTLLVLVLEVLLIFRPLVRRLRHEEEESARATDRLLHLAMHDELTDLPNRRRLQQSIDTLGTVDGPKRATLFMLDVNGLKPINDSMGHRTGDDVLRTVARRLAGIADDGLAARIGGDEFALLVFETLDCDSTLAIAQHIEAVVSEPLAIGDRQLRIGASIGFAHYPDQENDSRQLLAAADIALADAKKQPRGSKIVGFSARSRETIRQAHHIENGLRQALERRELVPFFQPQVALSDLRHVGFEVLARWNHPQSGLLAPVSWLPVAEDRGLIGQVTRLLTDQVLADVDAWRCSGLAPLRIAINMPEAILAGQDGMEEIIDTARRLRDLDTQLEIEVTENVFIDRSAAAIHENLRAARSEGITVALDDFGTGHASLSHLRDMPLDILKIDQSFIQSLDDRRSSALVNMLTMLAGDLGVLTIAEGVETETQLDQLRHYGCDCVQGYLFARPMPAEDAERYLYDRVRRDTPAFRELVM
ncbi:MAG: EAL domain-containing protein [Pseudomonadota bacterium]